LLSLSLNSFSKIDFLKVCFVFLFISYELNKYSKFLETNVRWPPKIPHPKALNQNNVRHSISQIIQRISYGLQYSFDDPEFFQNMQLDFDHLNTCWNVLKKGYTSKVGKNMPSECNKSLKKFEIHDQIRNESTVVEERTVFEENGDVLPEPICDFHEFWGFSIRKENTINNQLLIRELKSALDSKNNTNV
jgi:hypothetical protein